MKKVFLSGLFLTVSSILNAATVVATVESDAFVGKGTLAINQDVAGFISEVIFLGFDNQTVKYSLEQLRQGPQVLSNIDGTDVTYLSVEPDFNPGTGGHGVLKFLNNGVTKTYLNFRFLVLIQGGKILLKADANLQDPSSDKNPYLDYFNYIYLKKKMFMGQMVGVAALLPGVR